MAFLASVQVHEKPWRGGGNREEEEGNLFEGLIDTDDYRDCRNFAEANGRCFCSRRRSSGRNSAT